MWPKGYLLFCSTLSTFFFISNGCQMDGIGNWQLPAMLQIYDIDRGTFFSQATSNIVGINSITYGEGLNGGPYIDITFTNSVFNITTNSAYPAYEENETSQSMSITVVFGCTGGSPSTLVFLITVVDTNNNPPQFIPESYEFTLSPPLPPGFLVTGCVNDIIARDIDLTTQRIDFTIEDNPYFEIAYDEESSTEPKEFKAVLKTTTLIRTLPEVIELTITATDVDLTNDPPLSTTAVIRIQGDSEFELPEEPVFSESFYVVSYSESNQIVQQQPISLEKGYDDEVLFTLEGEYSDNFELSKTENQLSILVKTPLSTEILKSEWQVLLVVRAERELTSGATATVIVNLPQVVSLEFEQVQYEGMIIDNVLQPLQLILSQGYEDGFAIVILNEYASFFTPSVQGNVITVTMSPLDDDIIYGNNIISLQVVASTEYNVSATAIVTLHIIKDDKITPVFDKAIYMGSYDTDDGISLEQIVLAQGYDTTVSFSLEGEHSSFFDISNDGPIVNVTSSSLPVEILTESYLILTVAATKPRTVGANATISVTLPPARELFFQESKYTGTVEDNFLALEPIVLSVGYGDDVTFNLTGDYADLFSTSVEENVVSLNLSTQLPVGVILENNFILLTLSAVGLHTTTTSTNILLEILKQDITTPVFSQKNYRGSYSGLSNIDIDIITLIQGYDSSVSFRLDGEHADYFKINSSDNNNITLEIQSDIPEDLIFNEKVLVFNILAEKPLTVGGNSAITIGFPQELTDTAVMKFSRDTYIGSLENDTLTLENITLETGFAAGTNFSLKGDYSSYFTFSNEDNIMTVILLQVLPTEIFENNKFIVLQAEAQREKAVTVSASIVIDLIQEEIIIPKFNEPYYSGVYTEETGLQFEQNIFLSQGYDGTVTFDLDGDDAMWFTLTQNGNSISVVQDIVIPQDVLEEKNQLLFTIIATKPKATGNAVISIDLPKEIPIPVVLSFTQSSFVGRIENDELITPNITLVAEYQQPLYFNITGEYAAYFGLIQQDSTIEIALINELPLEATEENAFIILDIEVSFPEAFSGYTTLVLEIVKKPEPEIITPVFEQPYYMGEYSDQYGLLLQQPIQLIQGFDESVLFILTGDDSDWFDIDYNGPNNLSLSIVEDGLQQIKDRSHLVFSIIANKSDSLDGRAAIVITLTDFGIIKQVEFSQTFYKGIIENGNLTTDTIILSEGYTADMNVTFSGDYVDFFELTNQENIFTIQLLAPLQDEIIDANKVLILAIDVQVENVKSHTTVIIEIIKTDIIPLVFDEIYYVGSYSETENFNFEKNITVIKGYDDTVTFSLDGENAKWFGWQQEENSITLTVTNPIPNEVIANTSHLIFTITAYKSENMTASATITITLIDDTTTLTFEKNRYLGSLEKDVLIIEPINLRNESVENVTFELTGDLASYFTVANEGLTATISLLNPIPEDSIPSSNIITLELIATAPRSIAAYTTIIFGFLYEEVEQLSFNRTYYTGYYSESESLIFDELITLAEGYDESVEFELDEDGSEWFALNRTTGGNLVSLILKTPISQEIIFNNQQLIFTITAQKPGSAASRATIVITLIQETEDITILGFERNYYLGFVENEVASLDTVTLIEGYFENVTYSLNGDLADYFAVLEEGPTVNITLINTIPEDLIPINRIVVLELQASASQALSAFTTIVFEVVKEEVQQLLFNQTYYTGQYAASGSFVFETPIIISEGYDSNVEISLEGDGIQWFDLNVIENVAQVIVVNPIPQEVLTNNQQIILVINAQKPDSSIARATIVIALLDDTKVISLRFERNNYLGYIDNVANIDSIILSEGYTDDVSYNLVGDFADYFTVLEEGPAINITLIKTIPDDLIPINKIIVLELQASAPQAIFTYTIIVFEFIVPEIEQLIFSQTFYTGEYNATGNVLLQTPIFLTEGYDSYVEFTLEGEFTEWLDLDISENSVNFTVTNPIPQEILANTQQIILVIAAQKPGSRTANATIVLTVQDDSLPHTVLAFEKNSYLGSILDNSIYIDPIALEVSTEEVLFNLNGELASYFDLLPAGSAVNIILPLEIPDELVPANGIVILELEASAPGATSAFTTIVLEVVKNDTVVERLLFSETFYTGQYTQSEGLNFTNPIKLVQGYDENVQFTLEGESAQWFEPLIFENSVSLTLLEPIPQTVLLDTQQLIFVVRAEKPKSEVERATVVISLTADLQIDSGVAFDKVLFEGLIQAGIVQHESITVIGYNETNINISGEYAALFTASASAGVVTVQGSGSVTFADDITYVALELGAGSTYAVLILDVIHSVNPALPVVIFSSSSYALRIEVGQTGLVGRVLATADNGETVTYALLVDDAHLRQRISINHEGELYLSASANSGVYNFQVSATTVFSGTTGTAPVYLTVDAITVCGDDKLVVPPLITLNRDEEVAHENLVVLDDEKFAGCRYSLTNRWPINQTWLYVDENGLHATAIDREHESIAFMASSQVQVELILECDTDIETKRAKRSLFTRVMQDPLGPYDYGNNEWILTDTILYNSRRSLVNLIVNDINDNTPIFVGKENEPIAVGYPVTELEDRVLPRSLAELKATDADIGENAALIYWSSEDVLAVSPSTGFVHVSQGYQIEDGTLLTVHATDRNGDGLTGSIQLLVKLLDQSNIAVVTVRDAFLDDEQTILDNLSAAVGYEVRVLRSVVISNSTEIDPTQLNSRRKRETASATGVSLQLYVYGMIQREPVQVDQLTSDINNNALTTVNVASTISLEDHLDSHEIGVIPGRDTGLLVATIVLSVLLFILIVVAAVWFFLKWRKRQKYDEFSDEASVASQNASLAQMPKTESLPKPKLNIDELKRSERRLQEMLDAPVEEVTVEPIKSKKDTTPESKVNMSVSDPLAPIVIQSIDKLKDVEESDDDEFGEQPNVKRKSVVTFNENVEKIIHLEDTPEEESSDYEVYKF